MGNVRRSRHKPKLAPKPLLRDVMVSASQLFTPLFEGKRHLHPDSVSSLCQEIVEEGQEGHNRISQHPPPAGEHIRTGEQGAQTS